MNYFFEVDKNTLDDELSKSIIIFSIRNVYHNDSIKLTNFFLNWKSQIQQTSH